MSNNKRWLADQIAKLTGSFATPPLLIPALMGAYVNGLKTLKVFGRSDFVWVRVRGSNSDILQVFNDKVQRHWDLPVLIYQDIADDGTWKVYGRDINVYEDWGDRSYVINHGSQHSFSGGQTAGGDIVWINKRQFMPLLTHPNATATMSVYVEADYYFFDEQYKWWPGSGTSDLSVYKPTGSLNGKFLTVWLKGSDGSLQIAEGNEFSMLGVTTDPTAYIAAPPINEGFPLAGVLLQTGTARIGWGELYDLRQMISQPPSTGTTIGVFDDSAFNGNVESFSFESGLDVTVTGAVAFITNPSAITTPVTGTVVAWDEGSLLGSVKEINYIGNGINASVTGTYLWVNVPALEVFDNSVLNGEATQISFESGLDVSVSGTTVFVDNPGAITTPVTGTVVALDTGIILGSVEKLDFGGAGVTLAITGSHLWADIPAVPPAGGSNYFRSGAPIALTGITGSFYRTPDASYATGSLSVFVDGIIQGLDIDFQYQHPVSGTFELLGTTMTGSLYQVSYGV